MSSKVEVNQQAFPILGLLGVAFIVLKLMGYITWSWWWVLAPFWVPMVIGVVFLAVVAYHLFKT